LKFNEGDTVRRIMGSFHDMNIGDTAIVVKHENRHLKLVEYPAFHDADMFIKVSNKVSFEF
jgi:hypothetical protein